MLALCLPLRLAARATHPSKARIATPIVTSPLFAARSYATTPEGTESVAPKKRAKKGTESVAPKKPTKKAAVPLSKKAQKEAAAKAAYKLLSPEEKAEISTKAKQAKQKEKVKLLKAQALSPPTYRGINSWTIYVKENTAARANGGSAVSVIKQLAEEYKGLDSSQKEHYERLVTEHNAKSLREYQEWLNDHTPAQINAANVARHKLRRELAKSGHKYSPIKDQRLVKRPRGAYLTYHGARLASGEFSGQSIAQSANAIGHEYKALSASEKKKYEDMAAEDLERYRREHLEVYGVEPSSPATVVKASPDEPETDLSA
ncbi:hypothetical protein E4T43_00289 [Aureobasidium subglaciale]|nr:hypothetical protein E4T43_00289 [Aureobasidium subglaciale]